MIKFFGITIYIILSGSAIYRTSKICPTTLAFYIFPVAYMLAYAVGNPVIFEWYAIPILPFVFFTIFVGFAGLEDWIRRKPAGNRMVQFGEFAAILVLIIAGVIQGRQIYLNDQRQGRELAYTVIADKVSYAVQGDIAIAGS